jgi:hypothetical protein
MSTTHDTVTEENVYELGQEWMQRTSRQEKLEYLYETCSEDFIKNHLVQEMVTWMGEDDFTEFFEHLCRHWEIKNPYELDLLMNS